MSCCFSVRSAARRATSISRKHLAEKRRQSRSRGTGPPCNACSRQFVVNSFTNEMKWPTPLKVASRCAHSLKANTAGF
jgi:hypothetical protein